MQIYYKYFFKALGFQKQVRCPERLTHNRFSALIHINKCNSLVISNILGIKKWLKFLPWIEKHVLIEVSADDET